MADARKPFATIEDVRLLWRSLTLDEAARVERLLPLISDKLRQEAKNLGHDLDLMIQSGEVYDSVVRSVTVDVCARVMMTPTDEPPMTQMSQSALGYSVSGTYLVPGGGIFIKRSELASLGLTGQKVGAFYAQIGCCH